MPGHGPSGAPSTALPFTVSPHWHATPPPQSAAPAQATRHRSATAAIVLVVSFLPTQPSGCECVTINLSREAPGGTSLGMAPTLTCRRRERDAARSLTSGGRLDMAKWMICIVAALVAGPARADLT